MPHYHEARWSTTLPAGWSASHDDESTLLHRQEEGVGTLAVTLLCDTEKVTPEKVKELAASTLEEGHEGSAIILGDYAGLYFSYHEAETGWREWYLAAGTCLFFITYDCPQCDEQVEAAEVEGIITALRLRR